MFSGGDLQLLGSQQPPRSTMFFFFKGLLGKVSLLESLRSVKYGYALLCIVMHGYALSGN